MSELNDVWYERPIDANRNFIGYFLIALVIYFSGLSGFLLFCYFLTIVSYIGWYYGFVVPENRMRATVLLDQLKRHSE
jgi:hypothetical protein